jgi:hypothetical protein
MKTLEGSCVAKMIVRKSLVLLCFAHHMISDSGEQSVCGVLE